jgi:hypothetical protein
VQVPLGWPDGSSRAALSLVRTSVVSEARAAFAPWGSLVLRLWRGADEVEVEWTVGPVPIEDGVGKEVMLRLRSDVESGALLTADVVRLAGFWSNICISNLRCHAMQLLPGPGKLVLAATQRAVNGARTSAQLSLS